MPSMQEHFKIFEPSRDVYAVGSSSNLDPRIFPVSSSLHEFLFFSSLHEFRVSISHFFKSNMANIMGQGEYSV